MFLLSEACNRYRLRSDLWQCSIIWTKPNWLQRIVPNVKPWSAEYDEQLLFKQNANASKTSKNECMRTKLRAAELWLRHNPECSKTSTEHLQKQEDVFVKFVKSDKWYLSSKAVSLWLRQALTNKVPFKFLLWLETFAEINLVWYSVICRYLLNLNISKR